ncbi:MAG: hypothetical protein IPG89_10670 [Bacteroidetes bacterium]|nr:hypothetical protein [Bacteroidota bacterium]
MLKQATEVEIEKLTLEYTWMGGEPQAMEKILNEFEFSKSAIQLAIDNVMNSHCCGSTYQSALTCKRLLEKKL